MSDVKFGRQKGNPNVDDKVIIRTQEARIRSLEEKLEASERKNKTLQDVIDRYQEHDKRQKEIFYEGTLKNAVDFLLKSIKSKEENCRIILDETNQMINLNSSCRGKIRSLINYLTKTRLKEETLLEKLQAMLENS